MTDLAHSIRSFICWCSVCCILFGFSMAFFRYPSDSSWFFTLCLTFHAIKKPTELPLNCWEFQVNNRKVLKSVQIILKRHQTLWYVDLFIFILKEKKRKTVKLERGKNEHIRNYSGFVIVGPNTHTKYLLFMMCVVICLHATLIFNFRAVRDTGICEICWRYSSNVDADSCLWFQLNKYALFILESTFEPATKNGIQRCFFPVVHQIVL